MGPIGVDVGGEDRALTQAESEFLAGLHDHGATGLDVWRHSDPNGTPWLLVSFDVVEGGAIVDVLRLDFDSRGLRGGRSPGLLNWDDGVRAEHADIDLNAAGALPPVAGSPRQLASIAYRWFVERAGHAGS